MICGICKRNWPDARCKVIQLTDAERTFVQASSGGTAPTEFVYCGPCWKTATDRVQGAQLISGLLQTSMQASGSPDAQRVGKKFREFLLSKSGKPVS
jgi:hypothetical protein